MPASKVGINRGREIEMNKTRDPGDSGTPKEAMLHDRAAELSLAVLGHKDPAVVARCVKAFRRVWQRGYTAGANRTARRLGVYR